MLLRQSYTPIKVLAEVDKVSVAMEVDVGAPVTIMSKSSGHKLWPRRGLNTSIIRLETYTITVEGGTEMQVVYEGQTTTLPLVIVKEDGPTLWGRNWLSKMRLNWREKRISPGLQELLSKYVELFQECLVAYKDYEVTIEVDPGAAPRFCKARTVPYVMVHVLLVQKLKLSLQVMVLSIYHQHPTTLHPMDLLSMLYRLLRKDC